MVHTSDTWCSYRVVDARLVLAGVGSSHDRLVGVHGEAHQHLDQHREEQIPMDPGPVVLQLPVETRGQAVGSDTAGPEVGKVWTQAQLESR